MNSSLLVAARARCFIGAGGRAGGTSLRALVYQNSPLPRGRGPQRRGPLSLYRTLPFKGRRSLGARGLCGPNLSESFPSKEEVGRIDRAAPPKLFGLRCGNASYHLLTAVPI